MFSTIDPTRTLWTALLLFPFCLGTTAVEAADEGTEYFEKHVRPLLINNCYECHASDVKTAKGELLLDRKSGWEQGGISGPAIVPGKPDESLLISSVHYESYEMPPNKPLSEKQIDILEKWVAMGAPDPRIGTPSEQEQKIAARAKSKLWSLQPLNPQAPPEFPAEAWPHSKIDRYVFARLQEKKLTPVKDADKLTWLRRVTFDLIGLPPQPEEIREFVRDDSPQAREKVVDRLLASQHFGEKWGRHWLDVARYAESSGKAYNVAYPYAWRYRDYVIESFNKDKPYDEFIQEQIAGDLLPAQNDQEELEQKIATGFLAMGVKDHNARNDKQFYADVVDEQINVTSRAILGMTMACARCHDHKFDPIAIEDYYAMAGIFHSTEPLYGTSDVKGKGGTPNKFPAELMPIGENGDKLHEAYLAYEEKAGKLSKQARKARRDVQNLTDDIEAEKDARKKEELEKKKQEAEKRRDRLNKELAELRKNPPKRPEYAMSVRESKKPKDIRLHKSGSYRDLGDPVPRGFPEALSTFEGPELDAKTSGRLGLAKWLSHEKNPLTARVMVNRVWQHLFGQGLVHTPGNFGNSGKEPTHPELLDHLSEQFIAQGWSTKKLIRSIVLSRTYQLSTTYDEQMGEIDPDNEYLWRMTPKQLDAEFLRDAILFASGELDRSRPENGSVLSELGPGIVGRNYGIDKILVPSEHRSVYLPILRDALPASLKLFGFGNPTLVVADRKETVVPEQALYMLNSDFVREQSRLMAKRLLKQQKWTEEQRIRNAYLTTLSRQPTAQELQMVKNYLYEQRSLAGEKAEDLPIWSSFCQALFASAEFRYLIDAKTTSQKQKPKEAKVTTKS